MRGLYLFPGGWRGGIGTYTRAIGSEVWTKQ